MASANKRVALWLVQTIFLLIHYSGDAFQTHSSQASRYSPLTASINAVDTSQYSDGGTFTTLIQSAANILTASDVSENEIEHSYGSASQGQWICSKSASKMQMDVLEGLMLKQVGLFMYSSYYVSLEMLFWFE